METPAKMKRLTIINLMVLCAALLSAQELGMTKHISSADGLSNDFVISLAIDGQGYVWAATEAGVNRIAGKTCQPLAATIPMVDMRITSLLWHTSSGMMLIGAEQGLTAYRPSDGMTRQMSDADGLLKSSINDMAEVDNSVWLAYGNGKVQLLDCKTFRAKTLELNQAYGNRCLMDDGKGTLYIGHSQHGMTVVNVGKGPQKTKVSGVRHYQQRKDDPKSLPGNNVRCIYQDREGRVWVGTDHGLALFHPESGTFTKVTQHTDLYDDNVYDIHQMRDGRLWVATDIGGIKVVGPTSPSAEGKLYYDDTKVMLSSLNTRSIAEDEYGNIWVGNHSTGIDFISNTKPDFSLLDFTDEARKNLPVYALAKDTEKGFWMATEKELILCEDGRITRRLPKPEFMRREYSSPRCLMADHHGGVWIGVDDQGAYRFDRNTARFSHIPINPEGSDIHSFAEDAEGHIWIGGEFGVWQYADGVATQQDAISRVLHAPATSIMHTTPDRLFITTLGDGVYSFDLQTKKNRHLSISGGLPSGKVNQAIRTKQGGVWLATDAGLVYLEDPIGLTGIHVYGKENGLNDIHILALQQDITGRIWMSTYSGIICFVPGAEKFYNYSHQDTWLSGGFASGTAATDEHGTIYFGSASGVCFFNPQQMSAGIPLSDVQIVSCEAYNPVGRHTEVKLMMPDSQGRVFTTYQQNTIRLKFAMRNFAQNDQVDYSYMMEGMDGKWYDIADDHDVVFRALRPGKYTFILRAKLHNQDWSQSKYTRLTIIITPPFWRTWWAYLLYALLALAATTYFVRSYKRKLTLRSTRELEHRENLQKQKMNEERLRFFTNITHELRTPLTLILGPLDDLMEDRELAPQTRHRVAMIHKSAERLRNLINEILEFRKTETQNRRLTVARGDIGQFVREIFLNYKELNRNPKVHFVSNIATGLPDVWFDSEIITTVLNNFLSNAIKYTEQGSITVSVKADKDNLQIAVADSGYGIAPAALPHIFERYYQANDSHQASGTGIGLALVKSLAELHEATVSVESQEGTGSTFTLSLQIANNYPNALHKEDVQPTSTAADVEEEPSETAEESLPTLLVVEDNDDIRQYIAETFSDDFRIIQAANGEEGLQMAKEHFPDIIVSDIMMPKMNGI